MSRDTPMMMRRIRKRNVAPVTATASSAAEYSRSLRRVTPAVRSSMASLSTHGATSDTPVVTATAERPTRNWRR